MLQAFVSLQPQQPPRTESGLQGFFESLSASVLSPPKFFCTNVDATAKPFTVEDIAQACMNQRCKFAVLRGVDPYFWQATVLMPDKDGMAAMFFQLEDDDGKIVPSVEAVDEFAKLLYRKFQPRMIRVGDSEAREKLKSRHGLVLMPGLGRIEWLQIVHPDVYSELYNPSELVAAPAYGTEIWEDGALYLRVYGDPKDWDNEENISLANFIPGFLAGTANVQDGEKEKQNVRAIEKLWNRANKTADRAKQIFKPEGGTPTPTPKAAPIAEPAPKAPEAKAPEVKQPEVKQPEFKIELPTPTPTPVPEPEPEVLATPEPVEPEPELVSEPEPEPEDEGEVPTDMALPDPEANDAPTVVYPSPLAEASGPIQVDAPSAEEVAAMVADLSGDIAIDPMSILPLTAGYVQQIYSALDTSAGTQSKTYFAFGAEESKLLVLDRLEDFAAFLQGEAVDVNEGDRESIVHAVTAYHRPYLRYLDAVADVPGPASLDPRLDEFDARIKPPFLDVSDETQQLHIWAFNPRSSSIEEILIRQFEDWPLTMEVKRHLLDLKEPTEVEATQKPKAKPAETPKVAADQADNRRTIMLIALVLILAIAAATFIFYFGADWTKLWKY